MTFHSLKLTFDKNAIVLLFWLVPYIPINLAVIKGLFLLKENWRLKCFHSKSWCGAEQYFIFN